jgi:hypothetical protein
MRILRRFLARVKNFAMGQRSREFGIRRQRTPSWSGRTAETVSCPGKATSSQQGHALAATGHVLFKGRIRYQWRSVWLAPCVPRSVHG